MGLSGILLYTGRAAAFALAVGAVYALYCLLKKQKLMWLRLVGLMYIAALVQITVLRGGVDWTKVLSEPRPLPLLVPLETTVGEARQGLWPLIYHSVGNLAWFVPLGMLLRRRRAAVALMTGAGLSLGIEIMQYALMTGTTDIDDLIFNSLGALLGWLMIRVYFRIKKKNGFE